MVSLLAASSSSSAFCCFIVNGLSPHSSCLNLSRVSTDSVSPTFFSLSIFLFIVFTANLISSGLLAATVSSIAKFLMLLAVLAASRSAQILNNSTHPVGTTHAGQTAHPSTSTNLITSPDSNNTVFCQLFLANPATTVSTFHFFQNSNAFSYSTTSQTLIHAASIDCCTMFHSSDSLNTHSPHSILVLNVVSSGTNPFFTFSAASSHIFFSTSSHCFILSTGIHIVLAIIQITLGDEARSPAIIPGVIIDEIAPYQNTQPQITHANHLGIIGFIAAQASAGFNCIPDASSNRSNASFLNERLSLRV
jgi:hypothetical protein